MYRFSAVLLELLVIFQFTNAMIPDYIHVCKRNDPAIEKCIQDSIEFLRPKLTEGIPELEVPGMEPLVIPEIPIGRSSLKAVGRNVQVFGASKFKITKLKVDLPNQDYYISIHLPQLDFKANYEVDGRILVIPIKGKGPLTAKAQNIDADAVLKGQIVKRNGVEYLNFESLDIDLKMKDYEVHLDNVFGGNKELGEVTNRALNENRREFMRALKPFVEKTVSEVLLDIANNIVKHFSYDELFPLN